MKLLIVGTSILAAQSDEFVETEDAFFINGAVYPKAVIEDHQVVDVDVPPDFALARYVWRDGALALSDAAIAADEADRVAAIKAQIAALEAGNPITARAQREQALVIMEIIKQVTGEYPSAPGFVRAKEVDDQIIALRALL